MGKIDFLNFRPFSCPGCGKRFRLRPDVCPACGRLLKDNGRGPGADPAPADAEGQILLNYYEAPAAVPDDHSSYELVLREKDGTLFLDEYTRGPEGGPERRQTREVSREAAEAAMNTVRRSGMMVWRGRDDLCGLEGRLYVCKYRQGDRLVRASSEAMPPDGTAAFREIRAALEACR